MKKALAKPGLDATPQTDFVAEAPIAVDAKPVEIIPPGMDPTKTPQAVAAKLAQKQEKALAKAARAALTGTIESKIEKTVSVPGATINAGPVAEIKLLGITLGQFEKLIALNVLRFGPKGK